jgi:hypothetical protein
MLSCSVVGAPATVREGVSQLVEQRGADELIVAAATTAHRTRLRSYEILAAGVHMLQGRYCVRTVVSVGG